MIHTTNKYVERWHDADFVSLVLPTLTGVFDGKSWLKATDVRGITVGFEDTLISLHQKDFKSASLKNIDFSHGRFACNFNYGQFDKIKFDKALFYLCELTGSKFTLCSFKNAKLSNPILNDCQFVGCEFRGTWITGRGDREYGGRRVVFRRCNFYKTIFHNLQFRAAQFLNCEFHDTLFQKILYSGVHFKGRKPIDIRFDSCIFV